MVIRNTNIRTLYEPEDDFGADEAFLQRVVSRTPAAPPDWQPLAEQISSQWQQFGIDPTIQGINRANELAQILTNYGITDLSKIGLKQTRYPDDEEPDSPLRGQLTYDDKTFGRLGGFGSSGGQEFGTPQEFLTEAGGGRYGLTASAAGKGYTDYEVVVGPGGKPVIVPRWGSSSDAGDIAPLLAVASFIPGVAPFAAAANAALSLSQGNVLGGIASLAGLGGFTDVANAARLASAVKNEDILGAVMPSLGLAGVSDVGGFDTKDIGKAVNVARAIQTENPLALAGAASAYLPGPNMPGLSVDKNIQEGFFEPGGPGYIEPPAQFMLPETEDPTQFWNLPEPSPAPPPEATPISAPERMAFLEANIPEPETVQQLMQQYYPEVYPSAPVDNEMAKLLRQQELAQAGESALGGIGPNAKELPLINLSGSPAPAPGKAPAAPKKAEGPDFEKLLLASMMMTPQQQAKDDYQLAQIGVASPYGIYGA